MFKRGRNWIVIPRRLRRRRGRPRCPGASWGVTNRRPPARRGRVQRRRPPEVSACQTGRATPCSCSTCSRTVSPTRLAQGTRSIVPHPPGALPVSGSVPGSPANRSSARSTGSVVCRRARANRLGGTCREPPGPHDERVVEVQKGRHDRSPAGTLSTTSRRNPGRTRSARTRDNLSAVARSAGPAAAPTTRGRRGLGQGGMDRVLTRHRIGVVPAGAALFRPAGLVPSGAEHGPVAGHFELAAKRHQGCSKSQAEVEVEPGDGEPCSSGVHVRVHERGCEQASVSVDHLIGGAPLPGHPVLGAGTSTPTTVRFAVGAHCRRDGQSVHGVADHDAVGQPRGAPRCFSASL